MDVGRVEREGQPIIFNLFPVGRESVLTAFINLSPRENRSGAQLKTNKEKRILDEKNPHVSAYFSDFAQEMKKRKVSEEAIDQVSWGVIICHRALRGEAKARGGILPTFTDEFIQEAHNKEVKAIQAMSVDKQISVPQAAIQLGKLRLVEFENLEPEFSKIVRNKLGLQSDWRPEQDFIYTGIIDLYLLFKEGCSDPKNFQQ